MRKTAATSDRQRTRKPLFYRHMRPAETTDQAPDRLCKQEVGSSILPGSIPQSSAAVPDSARRQVLKGLSQGSDGSVLEACRSARPSFRLPR